MNTAAKLGQYRRELEEQGFNPDLVRDLVMKAAEEFGQVVVEAAPSESDPKSVGDAVRQELDRQTKSARRIRNDQAWTIERLNSVTLPALWDLIADARKQVDVIEQLKRKGLKGDALAELIDGASIPMLRAFAGESREGLAEYQRLFNHRKFLLEGLA